MTEFSRGLLQEFFSTIFKEISQLVPKLLTAILMLVAAFIILKLLGGGIRKLLSMADVDGMIKRYSGIELPISFNAIILSLLYVGVALALIYGMINLFFGETYVVMASSIIIYGARVISVIALAIILFTAFSAIIERIRVESRMKGYLFFIVMLLLTAMLIDITALSEPVKHSLYMGLSIGIGASLAIFSAWFFFHEYLDKLLERKRGRK